MPPLILYIDSAYLSPYALSAYVSLKVKGLDFEEKLVNLDTHQNEADTYSKISLTARVPTLVDKDFSLSESSAISEYLDENYGERQLYPKDSLQRARARQIQAWLRSDLLPLRTERNTCVIFRSPSSVPLSEPAKKCVSKLLRLTEALLSPNKKYLFDAWSIIDIDLALMLNRLVANGDSVPDQITAYVARHWDHPAIQEWVEKSKTAPHR